MKKGMVRDAATAKIAAQVYEILRGCDVILSEHEMRTEQGHYGDSLWVVALSYDLVSVRGRLNRVRALIAGSTENLGA